MSGAKPRVTPALAPTDGAYLRRALLLARRGWGQTAPNPLVGAVVVREGRVVGEGWHAVFGGAHAEVAALAAAGESARGATIYVSLEPCNHQGKTPPCVDALLAAGVRRVVIAHPDPNPRVAGGVARLRAAGVEVAFADGDLRDRAADLNAPFFFAHAASDRPFVSLKLALSIEGAIARADRAQVWLTGQPARRYSHRLRAEADAIAVGIGTAIADNPALTVRYGKRPRVTPTRVVFDRTARLPLDLKLVKTAKKLATWVLAGAADPGSVTALEKRGVRVWPQATLQEQLAAIRSEGIHHLLVEGGAVLAGTLLDAGVVDRLIIFQAPVRLGAGALVGLGSTILPTGDVERWRVLERRTFGDDLMTRYGPIR